MVEPTNDEKTSDVLDSFRFRPIVDHLELIRNRSDFVFPNNEANELDFRLSKGTFAFLKMQLFSFKDCKDLFQVHKVFVE